MSKKVWLVTDSNSTDSEWDYHQYEDEVYVVGIFSSEKVAKQKAKEYEKYNYGYIEDRNISTDDPYGDISVVPITLDQLYIDGKKIASFFEYNAGYDDLDE